MKSLLKKLWVEEEGQTMVEYALILALVAVGLIAAVTYLKGKADTKISDVGDSL